MAQAKSPLNNQGWAARRLSTLGVLPKAVSNEDDRFWINFGSFENLSSVAREAGASYAKTIVNPGGLKEILKRSYGGGKRRRIGSVGCTFDQELNNTLQGVEKCKKGSREVQ